MKIKLVIIGVWNTLFGFAVFFGFDTLFIRLVPRRYIAYLAAMALNNLLAIVNAYIFHKYVTFKSEAKGKGICSSSPGALHRPASPRLSSRSSSFRACSFLPRGLGEYISAIHFQVRQRPLVIEKERINFD